MSTEIDEKVVEMRFDNRQFESGVQTTMSTLEKLKQSLNLTGATKGLENVGAAAKSVDMSGLGGAVDGIGLKFNAMYSIADQALRNITNSAMYYGKKIVNSLTIEPVKLGFKEYETQMGAIQTILANTQSKGSTLDDVNSALDELNTYADKTIYNFTEMTRNIGTFTAAGVGLEESVSSIKGIANLAAVSGSTSQQASTAMYQLSQALSTGTVRLMDWNSVVNAGMGGELFQNALKRTAKNMGTNVDEIIDKYGSFRESLSSGWLTSDVLTETLTQLSGAYTEADLLAKGYTKEQAKEILALADTAVGAATEIKTVTQLFDTLKESVQSGWAQTWRILVGDFEEAKELLTGVSEVLGGFVNDMNEARNEMLENWKVLGGRKELIESFKNIFNGLVAIITPIKDAFREIFPPMTSKRLFELTEGFRKLTENFKISEETADNLKRTFKGIFAVFGVLAQVIGTVFKMVGPLVGAIGKLVVALLKVTAPIGDWLVGFNEIVKSTGVLDAVLGGLVGIISKVAGGIAKFIGLISDKFHIPGLETLKEMLGGVKDSMSGVSESAGGMFSSLIGWFKALGAAIQQTALFKVLKSLFIFVKDVVSGIADSLSTTLGNIGSKLKNAEFGDLIDMINSISLASIAAGIASIVGKFKKTSGGLSEIVENINDLIGGVTDTFKAFTSQIKANALLKLAGAIAILTVALVILGHLDGEKLKQGLVAIGVLIAGLSVLMKTFSKIDFSSIKANISGMALLVTLAIATSILATAVKKLSGLDPKSMITGVAGVAGLVVVLGGVLKYLSKMDKGTVIKGGTTLVLMAAAIRLLVPAVDTLGSMDQSKVIQGGLAVSALMIVMGIFAKLANYTKVSIRTGIALVAMSAALYLLIPVIHLLGRIDEGVLWKGVTAMSVLALVMGAFAALSGLAKHGIGASIAALAMGLALKQLVPIVDILGSMDQAKMWQGVGGIAAIVAAMSLFAAASALATHAIGAGITVIAIAAALRIMLPVIQTLGEMSWQSLLQAGIAIYALLDMITGALVVISNAVSLKAAAILIVVSAALVVLAGVLGTISALGGPAVALGLIAIAAGLAAVVGIGYLAIGASVGLIALSVAILALGLAVLAFGGGLALLATGLATLVAISAAGSTAIVAAFKAIGEGIAMAVVGGAKILADSVVVLAEAFAAIIVALCDAIIVSIPKILTCLGELLMAIVNFIVDYGPKLGLAAIKLINGLISALAEGIPGFIAAGVDLMLAFWEGISSEIPRLLDKGAQLVIDLINGIAKSIEEHSGELGDAFRNLWNSLWNGFLEFWGIHSPSKKMQGGGENIITGLKNGIANMASAPINAMKEVGTKIWNAAKEFPSKFISVGKDIMSGLKSGISSKIESVKTSITSACSKVWNAAKDFLGINSPSKKFITIGKSIDEGMVVGIKKDARTITKASEGIGKTAVSSMSSAISKVTDILNSDIDSQPTIRPVLDLSDIESGAGSIGRLLDGFHSVSVDANIGAINSMMNRRNQNGNNADVVSAIDKLGGKLGNGGNTYNINGITYNDDENLNNAVYELIRAARIERRT